MLGRVRPLGSDRPLARGRFYCLLHITTAKFTSSCSEESKKCGRFPLVLYALQRISSLLLIVLPWYSVVFN